MLFELKNHIFFYITSDGDDVYMKIIAFDEINNIVV